MRRYYKTPNKDLMPSHMNNNNNANNNKSKIVEYVSESEAEAGIQQFMNKIASNNGHLNYNKADFE